jgi:hypothetical protein
MDIKFIPLDGDTEVIFSKPIPATKAIPDWYKNLSKYVKGGKKSEHYPDATSNGTVKMCNPFLDSLMTGYIITLNTDVQVTQVDGHPSFVWKVGRPLSMHSVEQVAKEQAGDRGGKEPFKFNNEWVMKTPKGYSTLFTHPLNRTDLPFQTLSGVVETDTYDLPVHFPFILDKGFEGILEKGTPIAQAIPIKRESWKSSSSSYSKKHSDKVSFAYYSTILRAYKTLHWQKKDYK